MIENKEVKPGVYDITIEEYHSSAGWSRTALMVFANKTPRHFYHQYLNPSYKKKEKTDSLKFGGAVHPYILEPHLFEQQYFIAKKNPYHGSSKEGKAFKAEMLIQAQGKTLVDEKIKLVGASLYADEQARELITGAQYEKSIYWNDPETGLLLKCRPDIWHENFIVDLKTSKNPTYNSFKRDFEIYGYDLQAAMMHEGTKHGAGKAVSNFIDLAVENEEPHLTAIFPIDQTYLDSGLEKLRDILTRMKTCFDENNWPGYPVQSLIK